MSKRALIVEDDDIVRRATQRFFASRGILTDAAQSVNEARVALDNNDAYHLLVVDIGLADGTGFDVLRMLRTRNLSPAVIFMTGETRAEVVVEAMRWGAVDFLLKPCSIAALERSLARLGLPPNLGAAEGDLAAWRAEHCPRIHGQSAKLLEALDVVRRVAPTDCPVLVTGETGTGKELFARTVHAASTRKRAPFVARSCSAIPESLIESELFGYAKGAFTGAVASRDGAFVAAHRGTLFLDEIGEMPLPVQAKLLRALQEHEIQPIGSNRAIPVDVRVIAATHRDLDAMVREGRFREDLLYRLDVIRVTVPALRERIDDLGVLLESILDRLNSRGVCAIAGFAENALFAMQNYAWPGNIRQLQNVVERAVILRDQGVVQLSDLSDPLRVSAVRPAETLAVPRLPAEGVDLRDAVDRFERSLIEQALLRTNGNRNKAAAILGINRTTLVEKLRKRLSEDAATRDAHASASDMPSGEGERDGPESGGANTPDEKFPEVVKRAQDPQ